MSEQKQATVHLDVYAKPYGLIARRRVDVTGELAAAVAYLAETHPGLEYSVEPYLGPTYLFEAIDGDCTMASVVAGLGTPVMDVMEELIFRAQDESWALEIYSEEHEEYTPDIVTVHGPDEELPF